MNPGQELQVVADVFHVLPQPVQAMIAPSVEGGVTLKWLLSRESRKGNSVFQELLINCQLLAWLDILCRYTELDEDSITNNAMKIQMYVLATVKLKFQLV